MDRIASNKSNVVTPVIDVIDDETLKFQFSSATATSVGGFDWNLQVGDIRALNPGLKSVPLSV